MIFPSQVQVPARTGYFFSFLARKEGIKKGRADHVSYKPWKYIPYNAGRERGGEGEGEK